jgi:undecaprenyl-diphosphatase
MDTVLLIKVIIMGIVEGLTEFLPISSTGHLILAGSLLNFTGEKVKVFEIVIQAGAMLAVCWEYRRRIIDVIRNFSSDVAARRFVANLLVAFLPAVILGLMFGKFIKFLGPCFPHPSGSRGAPATAASTASFTPARSP